VLVIMKRKMEAGKDDERQPRMTASEGHQQKKIHGEAEKTVRSEND